MARRLSDEDRELWQRVVRGARRLLPAPDPAPDTRKAPLADPQALRPRVDPPPRPPLTLAPSPTPRGPAPRVRLDLVAPLSERLAAEPLRMDKGLHRAMTRGKLSPEARLDLHGMTLAQAHSALTGFVLSAHARGLRLVLIITGKGRKSDDHAAPMPARHGVLRHEVPQWLRAAPLGPLVLEVREAHRTQGGSGALTVYLRKRRQSPD